jgi:hypothetical protein
VRSGLGGPRLHAMRIEVLIIQEIQVFCFFQEYDNKWISVHIPVSFYTGFLNHSRQKTRLSWLNFCHHERKGNGPHYRVKLSVSDTETRMLTFGFPLAAAVRGVSATLLRLNSSHGARSLGSDAATLILTVSI